LVVEDIIDTGLTLSWLVSNLRSRGPASVEICALLRKPDAEQMSVDVAYVGYDIPNAFVVGYGLDYAEKYRNLRCIGTLAPHVYTCTLALVGPGECGPVSWMRDVVGTVSRGRVNGTPQSSRALDTVREVSR